jgi:exodeoxyribonuclease-5
MQFAPQQSTALQLVTNWFRDPHAPQIFRLFGYAGSGKSTLAKWIAGSLGIRVNYCAFTGKAALVMRKKGCHGASTIHSLIYKVIEKEDGTHEFVLNKDSDIFMSKLVIVDEVSMVNEELGRDLCSFGVKILVLGDPAQLPPVSGTGFFMGTPDVMLTEIHRQAAENPIIRMSMDVREGRALKPGTYGDSKIVRREDVDRNEVLTVDQVLVGMNRTRHMYNSRIRALKEYKGTRPQRGDRLVCLRNDKKKCLLNGGLWEVKRVYQGEASFIDMDLKSLDEAADAVVTVPAPFFDGTEEKLTVYEKKKFDQFTFGYALTVHKAQGSQWDSVMLFDESQVFREHKMNHLYTGITRAAEKITVVV